MIRRKRRRDEAPEDLLWIAPDAEHADKKAGVGGASAVQPIAFRRVSTGPMAAAFDHAAYSGRLAKQLREARTSGIVRVAVENGESIGVKAHDSAAAVQQHGRSSVQAAAAKSKASRRKAARRRIQRDRMLRFVDIDSSGKMQHPSDPASLPLRAPYVAVKGRILNAMERQVDEALWNASKSGVFDDLTVLLAQSPGFINFQRALADGSTALMAAAHHNKGQFAQWLLRGGAEPRLPDTHGRTALHHAAAAGHRELAAALARAENKADAENPVAGVSSPAVPGDAFEYDVYVSASATGHVGDGAAEHSAAAAAAGSHVRLPADMLGRFDVEPAAGELGDSETAESFEEYLARLAREEHDVGGVEGWADSDDASDSEDSNREDAPNTDYPEDEGAADDEHWLYGEVHHDGYGYGVETVDDAQVAGGGGAAKGGGGFQWTRQSSGYDAGGEDGGMGDSDEDVESWGVGGGGAAGDAIDAEDAAIGADQASAFDAAPGEGEDARQARVLAAIDAAQASGGMGAAIVHPASLGGGGLNPPLTGGGGLFARLRAPAAGSEAGRRITHEQFARDVVQHSRGGAASIGALSRGPGLDGLAGYVEPDDEVVYMGNNGRSGLLVGDIDPLAALPPGVAAQIRSSHGTAAQTAAAAQGSDSDTDL